MDRNGSIDAPPSPWPQVRRDHAQGVAIGRSTSVGKPTAGASEGCTAAASPTCRSAGVDGGIGPVGIVAVGTVESAGMPGRTGGRTSAASTSRRSPRTNQASPGWPGRTSKAVVRCMHPKMQGSVGGRHPRCPGEFRCPGCGLTLRGVLPSVLGSAAADGARSAGTGHLRPDVLREDACCSSVARNEVAPGEPVAC